MDEPMSATAVLRQEDLDRELERHRTELTATLYQMLGGR
jgi:hypothetical protein